jgi:hypothetical protein
VRGLLADLPRRNYWTLAEHAGDPSPDGMRHLLAERCETRTRSAMTYATMDRHCVGSR